MSDLTEEAIETIIEEIDMYQVADKKLAAFYAKRFLAERKKGQSLFNVLDKYARLDDKGNV